MHRKGAIDRYLRGELPARKHDRLLAHLRSCDTCRAHYDRQLRLARTLAGAPDAPLDDEHARLKGRALAAMQLVAPELAASEPKAPERAASQRTPAHDAPWWQLSAAVGAGLCVAAALLIMVRPAPASPEALGELTARLATPAPPVGVRARCLDPALARVRARADVGPRAPLASLRCTPDEQLAFSLTNLGERPMHMFVVGLVGRDVHWLPPFEHDGEAASAAPGAVDVPLASAAVLAPLADEGRLTLFVLFSEAPFSGKSVRDALSATPSIRATDRLDRLPIAVPWQARIELEVRP